MFGTTFFGFIGGSGGGGGGTIGGSIAATQVAFGSAANTIAGDSTFTFNVSAANKEVTANYFRLNNAGTLGSPVNGYLEYDGTYLYFTTGGVRFIVTLQSST